MAEITVFDALAGQLSGDERRELLERIRQSANLSAEPLFSADALPVRPPRDMAGRIGELGFFARIVLFFRRLLSGRTSEEIMVTDELADLARGVESLRPGLVDWKRELLLEGFAAQLRSLRDAARFFSEVLARSVEKDKGGFMAFLASIELPEIHARLVAETDPFARSGTGLGQAEIRVAVLDAWEDILRSLTEDKRRAMYTDLRSLLFLRRLANFLFDRILAVYRPQPDGGPAAPFSEARDLILELGDLLFSLAAPPSAELLEALFVFASRDSFVEPGFNAESAIGTELAAGAEALQHIRSFNARVPLGSILRLVSGDPDYVPREIAGGEDWFAIFKAHWKERIEARLDEYRAENRYRELATEIAQYVGTTDPISFPHFSREGVEGTPPLRFELALIFLEGFYRGPFHRELNRPLKILLVDGDFYRKDNRIEFTDAYNQILRIHEELISLDLRLAPEGEIGQAWNMATNEMISLNFKRRKLDSIRRGAEDEAERLIRNAADAIRGIARIIKGVLKGEAGGRYDSLQNLSSLDGRSNRDFLRALEGVRNRCEKGLLLLAELSGLDLGKVE